MPDKFSPEKRSEIMSKIRSKDTKYELLVRSYLHKHGFRFRKNDPRYPGKPDIVLPKYKLVIFIQGCFWHGHENCKYATIPKSNTDYWQKKINRNKARDMEVKTFLKRDGYRVIEIWECDLKRDFNGTMKNLVLILQNIET